MSEDDLVRRFEDCTLSPEDFHHRDHARLGWIYLRRYPVLESLGRFTAGLLRFARAQGRAERYHETITWAYLFLIRERMERAGREQGFEEFAADNADLFDWKDPVLRAYYHESTLASELARRVFVLPDRAPSGPGAS